MNQTMKFDYLVATGGLGVGILFKLQQQNTLGRNESRLGELTDYKDFCKQHIILHYVSAFLQGRLPVYAIGCVGADDNGHRVLTLMQQVGINTSAVRITDLRPTLYSVCFQYPDASGGNITTSNSASGLVNEKDILDFFQTKQPQGKGLLLAAPEVPLPARIALLHEGRKRGCVNVAALLSSEMEAFAREDGFSMTDLLSINQDEAQALVQALKGGKLPFAPQELAELAAQCVWQQNPNLKLIVTLGAEGAITFKDGKKEHIAPLPCQAVNTGGAGDSFLSTILYAMCVGIPLQKGREDKSFGQTPVACAAELATLVASMKVLNPDTIHFGIQLKSLYDFAYEKEIDFTPEVCTLFFDC